MKKNKNPEHIETRPLLSIPGSNMEPGLFIVWDIGRQAQDKILDDISAHFHIERVTEFRWPPAMLWSNYQRFYSDTNIRGSAHARNKGLGSFLAINVIVHSPVYDERSLSRNRGLRVVNTAMFDAKTRYREWTSEFAIHCGENLSENLRDIYMLFGSEFDVTTERELRKWNGTIEISKNDPIGAHGWRSYDELFGTLNRSVNYALIYYGPTEETMNAVSRGHSFDILTSDYNAAHTILHSGHRIPEPPKHGGRVAIRVDGNPIELNLRFPGDGLFDAQWGTEILDGKVYDPQGFYRPREDQQYWLMAHRIVAQRAAIDRKFMLKIIWTAGDQHGFTSSDVPSDDGDLKLLLARQLVQRGIWQKRRNSKTGEIFDIALSRLRRTYEVLSARIRTFYFTARDTILVYFPILSTIKKSITQDTGIRRLR
jgi:hypothetical protein